ncbi:MAG: YCF48-related protein [Candidatus Zixiibacteriota bacterium]
MKHTLTTLIAALLIFAVLGCSENGTSSRERILAVTDPVLEFTAWSGSNPNPAQQKVNVIFEKRPSSQWTAYTDADWIRIGPRGTDTVFVTVISTALAAGDYEDTIMVEQTTATNSPIPLVVRLRVLNRVNLSPLQMTFATLAGGQTPPAQELIIANFGVDSADYTIETAAPWLLISSNSGQMPDTVAVSVDITGLNAGLYIDSLVVNSPDLPNSRAIVPCFLSLSSWAAYGINRLDVTLEGVHFSDSETGWASGWWGGVGVERHHGVVYRSSDGGEVWTRALDQSPARFGGIASTDPARCVVVGDSAAIFITADSGKTWNRITGLPIGAGSNLRDVLFADSAHGWVIGAGGVILRTADSGRTWSKRPTPTGQDLTGLDFLDQQTGWVSGNHGTILHTGDGGITWVSQSSGTLSDLRAVSFVDNPTGWAAGADGLVIYTVNGGATWQPRDSLGDVLLLDIVFANRQRGWVTGIDGSIYRSDDGGVTWVEQESGVSQILTDLFYIDESLGWAVGTAGTVIKTANGGF